MNKIRVILDRIALRSRSQGTVTPNDFLASLVPMKRVLCLCPVPSFGQTSEQNSSSENKYEHHTVGIAVSDPYLAYATPVAKDALEANHALSLLVPKESANIAAVDRKSIVIQGLPSTEKEFLNQIGYSDIGALLFTLPLKQSSTLQTGKSDLERTKQIRDSIMCIVERFTLNSAGIQNDDGNYRGSLELQCKIDNHLTLNEVKAMAAEEPEMWEEVSFDCGKEITPDNQAAIALNVFLWEHTGGWRNTFA